MSRKVSASRIPFSFMLTSLVGSMQAKVFSKEQIKTTLQTPTVQRIPNATPKISEKIDLISLLPKKKTETSLSERQNLAPYIESKSANLTMTWSPKHSKFTSPDADVVTSQINIPVQFVQPEIYGGQFLMDANLKVDLLKDEKKPLTISDEKFSFQHRMGTLEYRRGNVEQNACGDLVKIISTEPGTIFTPIEYASSRFRMGYSSPERFKNFQFSVSGPEFRVNFDRNKLPTDQIGLITEEPDTDGKEIKTMLKGDFKSKYPLTGAIKWSIFPEQLSLNFSGGMNSFFAKESLREILKKDAPKKKSSEEILGKDASEEDTKYSFSEIDRFRWSGAGSVNTKISWLKNYINDPINLSFGTKYGHYAQYYEFYEENKPNKKDDNTFLNLLSPQHHFANQISLGIYNIHLTNSKKFDFLLGAGASFVKGGEWGLQQSNLSKSWTMEKFLLDRRSISAAISFLLFKTFNLKVQMRYHPLLKFNTINQVPSQFGFEDSLETRSVYDRIGLDFSIAYKTPQPIKYLLS